jgi:propanol-preferring alcohol dehydrogenase
MKAMVLEQFSSELILKDVAEPTPGDGEVLIKVHTCGTCGSDLKISTGKIRTTPLPHILGHEVAGEIAACGKGVDSNRVGERVAVHIYHSCGICPQCAAGEYNLCVNLRGRIGFEFPGGFGEYVVVSARNAIHIPDNISFRDASLVPCAMLAIYRAINRAHVKTDDRVVVLGVGGLGIHGIQFLKISGVQGTAVDINPKKLSFAKEMGAFKTLSYEEFNKEEMLYDVVLDNVGNTEVTKSSLRKLNKSGRYVMVAYSPKVDSLFDSEHMHLNERKSSGVGMLSRRV